MSRILLTVEYDGTDFVGWQRQAARRGLSVQQQLEEAISQVQGAKTVIHGAGRTDSGVHAYGQCCHFDLLRPVPVDKLPFVINCQLPPSVRVRQAQVVADDFHARIHATGKHYRYVIERAGAISAFSGRFTWQREGELDVEAMRLAAQPLLGRHDFRTFTTTDVSAQVFTREITRLALSEPQIGAEELPWRSLNRPLVIDVEGNGFLYKMVRIIVGRLVAVGSGRLQVGDMAAFLDGSFWVNIPPAPARGLTLVEVKY